MSVWIQDSLETGLVRHTDGSRRKAFMAISIVRRIHFKMLEQDSVKGVIVAECHGGVSLETYSLAQPVEINPCDGRILRLMVRLCLDD